MEINFQFINKFELVMPKYKASASSCCEELLQ